MSGKRSDNEAQWPSTFLLLNKTKKQGLFQESLGYVKLFRDSLDSDYSGNRSYEPHRSGNRSDASSPMSAFSVDRLHLLRTCASQPLELHCTLRARRVSLLGPGSAAANILNDLIRYHSQFRLSQHADECFTALRAPLHSASSKGKPA